MGPAIRRTLCMVCLCLAIISTLYLLKARDISGKPPDLGLFGIISRPETTPGPDPASKSETTSKPKPSTPRSYTQSLVVASTLSEDTRWINVLLPKLPAFIYLADDPSAPLHPPQNKGHESMMYLSYIISHYHNLSDTTIFTHAGQESWHNNDLFEFDLASMIQSVSNEHVQRVGYFNLRCHHESGCPDHIKPFNTGNSDKIEEPYFARVWEELHGPNAGPVPETLAVACCSQFAASRDAILAVPLERWVHYRDWLLSTDISDAVSGRIWEFTWHYILTGQHVVCPPIEQCYCDGYGLCFHDEGEIWSWLAMKEIQTLAKHMKTDYEQREDREGEKGDVDFHLGQRIGRPLGKWLREAELRGKDPYTRALLSGRGAEWVEGDGF